MEPKENEFPVIEEFEKLSNGRQGNSRPPAKKRRRWPKLVIDLGSRTHRRLLFFCLICVTFLSVAVLAVTYQGYAYSESSEFCGTVCHSMAPQFATYQASLHANVECSECHVGPGFSYYVQSKIEGLRQLVLEVNGNYSRPIKTPVHNLRPARETCEHCHAPTSFKDNLVKKVTHYSNNAENAELVTTLILKMGGWQQQTGVNHGIHWHITNPVYYIAGDEQRQTMQWVGVQQPDGSLREYYARDMLQMSQTAFVEEARAAGEVRQMDCIDCHNRTAHKISTPEELVDAAITAGQISASLPWIRSKAVALLKAKYASQEAADQAISQLTEDYRTSQPPVYQNNLPLIVQAVQSLRQIYPITAYPEMNLNWQTNPDNENHASSMGCFRCHDGKHVTAASEPLSAEPPGSAPKVNADTPDLAKAPSAQPAMISASCNLCHTVPIVGRSTDLLVEAPVIVGSAPASHADFSWTIKHQNISEAEKSDCFQCHGQGFCNNGVCHSLSHPPDMQFTHAEEYRKQGNQVCYTCHQNITCTRCHIGGIIDNP
jgi:nitrate/TMAO reductase-like tetraheme cytochrome c subunit